MSFANCKKVEKVNFGKLCRPGLQSKLKLLLKGLEVLRVRHSQCIELNIFILCASRVSYNFSVHPRVLVK